MASRPLEASDATAKGIGRHEHVVPGQRWIGLAREVTSGILRVLELVPTDQIGGATTSSVVGASNRNSPSSDPSGDASNDASDPDSDAPPSEQILIVSQRPGAPARPSNEGKQPPTRPVASTTIQVRGILLRAYHLQKWPKKGEVNKALARFGFDVYETHMNIGESQAHAN